MDYKEIIEKQIQMLEKLNERVTIRLDSNVVIEPERIELAVKVSEEIRKSIETLSILQKL